MSMTRSPAPSQTPHRPPSTLKLNLPAPKFRAFASWVAANVLRISSNALRYVTGFDRELRPIGDWSISTTSARPSYPERSR